MIKWLFYLLLFLVIRAFFKSRVRVVYHSAGPSRGESGGQTRTPQKFSSGGSIETSAREL